jgi:LmbE family N-acetylglucosaminyl deacetylase
MENNEFLDQIIGKDLEVVENRLWLLAHQDDEVMALHLHSNSVNNFVIYLTNGVRTGADYNAGTRINEARSAWVEIDQSAELIFLGTEHSLLDGGLESQLDHSHLHDVISICRDRNINEVVTLQLEGGHQDHDITSMFAEEVSRRLSLKLTVFPAYRALHKRFPVYAVMSSWIKNGVANSLPATKRIGMAKQAFLLMKCYGTQLTTWIGLGPFVILKYLVGKPTYTLIGDKQNTVQEFPKNLLYFNRKKSVRIDYESFRKKLSGW